MPKHFKYFFILIGILMFLTTCKKYPENRRKLFNSPKSDIVGSYFLTLYEVDGVDSIPLLNTIIGKDITSSISWEFFDKNNEHSYPNDYALESILGAGSYHFTDKLKNLNITFDTYNMGIQTLNVFISRNGTWQILALDKKKGKRILKIKREFNGKNYVIQFN